jgi:hypothetical protein
LPMTENSINDHNSAKARYGHVFFLAFTTLTEF